MINPKNIGSDFEQFFNEYITEDSGERRSFETGAIRDTDTNKPLLTRITKTSKERIDSNKVRL